MLWVPKDIIRNADYFKHLALLKLMFFHYLDCFIGDSTSQDNNCHILVIISQVLCVLWLFDLVVCIVKNGLLDFMVYFPAWFNLQGI